MSIVLPPAAAHSLAHMASGDRAKFGLEIACLGLEPVFAPPCCCASEKLRRRVGQSTQQAHELSPFFRRQRRC